MTTDHTTHLSEADLAIYYYSKAQVEVIESPIGDKFTNYYEADSLNEDNIYIIDSNMLDEYSLGMITVKPILRPLDEVQDFAIKRQVQRLNFELKPKVFKRLINNHFDVFGWIDAGLALDATTLTENPYNQ